MNLCFGEMRVISGNANKELAIKICPLDSSQLKIESSLFDKFCCCFSFSFS